MEASVFFFMIRLIRNVLHIATILSLPMQRIALQPQQ